MFEEVNRLRMESNVQMVLKNQVKDPHVTQKHRSHQRQKCYLENHQPVIQKLLNQGKDPNLTQKYSRLRMESKANKGAL